MAAGSYEARYSAPTPPRLLAPGALLLLYGPLHGGGVPTASSNAAFAAHLRSPDPSMGVRDAQVVTEQALSFGLEALADGEMPANNRTLVFGSGGRSLLTTSLSGRTRGHNRGRPFAVRAAVDPIVQLRQSGGLVVDFNNAKIPVCIKSRYSHNLIVTQVLRFMCIVVIQYSDANAKKHSKNMLFSTEYFPVLVV